jgi:hypothetical protein
MYINWSFCLCTQFELYVKLHCVTIFKLKLDALFSLPNITAEIVGFQFVKLSIDLWSCAALIIPDDKYTMLTVDDFVRSLKKALKK